MRRVLVGLVALVAAMPLGGLAVAPARAVVDVATLVAADAETAPVAHSGDAADDPAIWVSPTDPASSLVIGNDKLGALETYNLDGSLRQRISTSTAFWGNVDVRQQVTIGTRTLDVVAVVNAGLRMFTVDPATRLLRQITDGTGSIPTMGGEGLCLYHSQLTGDLSAFVITMAGQVRQWRIHDDDNDGLLEATMVRSFAVGSEAEGCVADDVTGALYVSQEDVALWRYGAEPTDGTTRTQIDQVQPNGHLAADIEGLTMVSTSDDGGYLIASAQDVADPNHSYFTVYDRKTGAYVNSFRIVAGQTADGCERTDGVAAYAGNLGPSFPFGLFVCQDNNNLAPGVGNQDFKLVRLEKIVDLGAGQGNAPPLASFTSTCAGLQCSFDASGSADPDGSVTGYAWDFGDSSGDTGVAPTHTYATPGPRTVTLTVTDNEGATASTTRQLSPGVVAVSFVDATSVNGNATRYNLAVPPAVQAGDALLLFFAGNTSAPTITGPSGWTLLQQSDANGEIGRLWGRVAGAADAGSIVTVSGSSIIKAGVTLAAYRGTAAAPFAATAAATDTTSKSTHTTPTVTNTQDGAWLLSYWADKSSAATAWTLPAGVVARSTSTGSGSGYITTALADSFQGLPVGVIGGLAATTGVASGKAVMFSVLLARASG
jgi:myo-inositol-hexaphosphate 3-phosphohydrolase